MNGLATELADTQNALDLCEAELANVNPDLAACVKELSTAQTELSTCEGDLAATVEDLSQANEDLEESETALALALARVAELEILGCMNANADNFDCRVNVDDGSCFRRGCMDPTADNFDPLATIDDGSCQFGWVARFGSAGQDRPTDVEVDSQGNIYVTGSAFGIGTGRDFATVKYTDRGEQAWVASYAGNGNLDDYASALAVDELGNIYVTGSSVEDVDAGFRHAIGPIPDCRLISGVQYSQAVVHSKRALLESSLHVAFLAEGTVAVLRVVSRQSQVAEGV